MCPFSQCFVPRFLVIDQLVPGSCSCVDHSWALLRLEIQQCNIRIQDLNVFFSCLRSEFHEMFIHRNQSSESIALPVRPTSMGYDIFLFHSSLTLYNGKHERELMSGCTFNSIISTFNGLINTFYSFDYGPNRFKNGL